MEEDLRALKDNSWTPVSVSAVLRYVLEGDPLPDRPVLLVFDDGYRSFLTRALPLLRVYDAPAAVSVIGRQARAGDGGAFMSWDELQEAAQSGLVGGIREPLRRSARLLPALRRGPSGVRERGGICAGAAGRPATDDRAVRGRRRRV